MGKCLNMQFLLRRRQAALWLHKYRTLRVYCMCLLTPGDLNNDLPRTIFHFQYNRDESTDLELPFCFKTALYN